jgi:hypothetical protein
MRVRLVVRHAVPLGKAASDDQHSRQVFRLVARRVAAPAIGLEAHGDVAGLGRMRSTGTIDPSEGVVFRGPRLMDVGLQPTRLVTEHP